MIRILLVIILVLVGCARVATSEWFRTYNEDIKYYEFVDARGASIILTDDQLDSITLYNEQWWDYYRLKSITLKDVE